jgi:hypothetical protein
VEYHTHPGELGPFEIRGNAKLIALATMVAFMEIATDMPLISFVPYHTIYHVLCIAMDLTMVWGTYQTNMMA